MTAYPQEAINLTIEYLACGNDTTDHLGWQLGAIAAIAYDEGPYQGIHYMVPVNQGTTPVLARDMVEDMIESSGCPYTIVNEENQ